VRAKVDLPARPDQVWAELRDIRSHVTWMDDAVRITVTSERHEGVDTTIDCLTRIGPFRFHDRMRVIEWVEGRAIGIRHEGIFKGRGRFTIQPKGRKRTRLVWKERVRPPWWLGGPLTGVIAGRVVRRVARRDLANFRNRFGATG
jgi:carbon monoxide dehydrogenase subunit G